MDDLYNLETIKDVFEFIMDKYPSWIITTCDKYSEDYNFLNTNWDVMVNNSGSRKQKVIIVDSFSKDKYLVFSELLTKVGFVIRTKDELISCNVCHLALPSKQSYNKLKDVGKNVPAVWKDRCSRC